MSVARYEFVDATFHFFKVFGRRPLRVVSLAIWQLIAYGALTALVITAAWPVFSLLMSAGVQGVDPDPDALLATLIRGWGLIMLAVLASFVLILMVQGAWLRLLARDEMAPIIPFRFGADELRLLGINLLFSVFLIAGYLLTALVFVVINTAVLGADQPGGVVVQALANTGLVIVALFAWILIMLGFAASPALAVRQRGFRFFSGFAASRGRKGKMFLSYLVLILVNLMILIFAGVFQQVIMLIGAADLIAILPELETTKTAGQAWALVSDRVSMSGFVIAIVLAMLIQLLAQFVGEGLWHGVGAYVATLHDGGFDADAPIESAPRESVGAAPLEG